tara:strand:- start:130 stop:846 length:717 start_codon:yes stop_codon:yes gene_type:complete
MKLLRLNLIIIIFFLTLILIKTSTTSNLINLVKYNYDERWNKVYGYCENEALGFVKYIQKKYEFETTPKIVNFKKFPDASWVLMKSKINQSKDKIILLNYIPKQKYKLKKIKNNKYISENTIFSVSSVDSVIINKSKGNLKGKLKIYKSDAHKDILIDEIIFDEKNEKIIFNEFSDMKLNNPMDPLDRERKYIIKIETDNEIELNKIKNVTITFNNIYNLDKYKIIERYDNCFFIKND